MPQDGVTTAGWSRAQSESGQAELYLELLGEYAPKLWELCREYGERRRRRVITILVPSIGVALLLAFAPLMSSFFEFDPKTGINLFFSGSFAVAILVCGATIWMQFGWQSSDRLVKEDMEILGEKVEKLVAVASQFNEHVESDPARKLQFDFRLLEAEAALRMCDGIVGRAKRAKETGWASPTQAADENERRRKERDAFMSS